MANGVLTVILICVMIAIVMIAIILAIFDYCSNAQHNDSDASSSSTGKFIVYLTLSLFVIFVVAAIISVKRFIGY